MSTKTVSTREDATERQSEHSHPRHLAAVVAPYLPPWVLCAAAGPVAEVSHLAYGTNPWAAVAYTGVTAGLGAVTWRYSSKRSPIYRVHATATTAVTGVWMTAATITGLTENSARVWGLGALALATSWNLRRATRNSGRDVNADANKGFFEAVGLARSKAREIVVEPNRVTAKIAVPGDQLDADDVKRAKGRMASVLSVPANGVRVTPNPDHHDEAEIVIVPEDMLRESPAWPGPSAPGATMAAPLVFGMYEDVKDMLIYAAADAKEGRNLAHLLLIGMTGAGKGVIARNLVSEIGTRAESTLWMIDIVKRDQTFGCASDLIDWFATTRDEAEAMMDCLDEVISARAAFLGSRGLDNWEPGCGLSHLTVWIEEAQSVLRDSQAMVDRVAAARSAGVKFVVSIFRGTHDNMPTSLRGLFGETICCGVRDEIDAVIALGESVVSGGADPAAWGNSRPGYCYVTGPGIPESRFTTAGRSFGEPFKSDPSALTRHLALYAHLRDPLDPVTASAAGRAYANRTGRPRVVDAVQAQAEAAAAVGQPFRVGDQVDVPVTPEAAVVVPAASVPKAAAPMAAFFGDAPVDDGEEQEFPVSLGEDMAAEIAELGSEFAGVLKPTAPETSHEPDVFAEALEMVRSGGLDGGDEEAAMELFGAGAAKTSPEEAREALRKMIDELEARGAESITAPDMAPFLKSIGRSRGWLLTELNTLVASRRLIKGKKPGDYRIRAMAGAAG